MTLNSSKVMILTLLVFFLAGCNENKSEIPDTSTPTQTALPSATIPVTPFPTARPATETPAPAPTKETAPSATPTTTATALPTNVAVIPDPAGYTWEMIAEGFSRPTGLGTPQDGSGRLFVLEQEGLIHIIQDGQRLPVPFLDLREVTSTRGSTVRGLQGITFHPKYAENGYFFVHYTQEGGDSVIARYQVSADFNLANPGSEMRLLKISYPIGEHVGGGMAFGPDGKLYFSIGDGGAGGNGDEAGNAQNPQTYLGSIIRVNVDIVEEPEVWAIGLRNPWRFSFDALNGDLYLADVGENKWEEINYIPAEFSGNLNFGWNFYEGDQPYRARPLKAWNWSSLFGSTITLWDALSPGDTFIAENCFLNFSAFISTATTAPAIFGGCYKSPMVTGRTSYYSNFQLISPRLDKTRLGRFIWQVLRGLFINWRPGKKKPSFSKNSVSVIKDSTSS